MFKGKKYKESTALIDKTKLYDADEAIALVCQTAKAKFDETIELHIRLGVDSRHADQQVRGAVVSRTEQARQSAHWCSQKATTPRMPRQPERIMSALRILWKRFRKKTGLSSTS